MLPFLRILLAFSLGLMALSVSAQMSDDERAREEEISQRAKQRQYPGGSDESDLKVQSPLPVPVRKVAPTTEDENGALSDSEG